MSETQLTSQLGWLQEATYGLDPAQDTNQGFKIGKNIVGNFPRVKQEVTINHNNSYAPSERVITKHVVQDNLAFEPVNCLPLKYMFTKNDGTGITDDGGANLTDGTRTIDPVVDPVAPNEQRASWAWRKDRGNSTENLRDHILGNMMLRFTETFNIIGGPDQRLINGFDYLGKKRVTPATDVSNPPIYPNSSNDSYKKDGNTIVTWDGDNMLPQLVQVQWNISAVPQSHPADVTPVQHNVERVTTGNFTYGATVNIRRAGGFSKNFDLDLIDQLDNKSSYNDLRVRIHNTASNFKDVTLGGCTITDIQENIIIESEFVAHPTYQITLLPLTWVYTFKDGLNKTTFYNL